jgi:intracellular sulfur oxidation DsrE/DsrF family protein
MKKLKVLLHTNGSDRWKVALGNAENLLKAVGEGAGNQNGGYAYVKP